MGFQEPSGTRPPSAGSLKWGPTMHPMLGMEPALGSGNHCASGASLHALDSLPSMEWLERASTERARCAALPELPPTGPYKRAIIMRRRTIHVDWFYGSRRDWFVEKDDAVMVPLRRSKSIHLAYVEMAGEFYYT